MISLIIRDRANRRHAAKNISFEAEILRDLRLAPQVTFDSCAEGPVGTARPLGLFNSNFGKLYVSGRLGGGNQEAARAQRAP